MEIVWGGRSFQPDMVSKRLGITLGLTAMVGSCVMAQEPNAVDPEPTQVTRATSQKETSKAKVSMVAGEADEDAAPSPDPVVAATSAPVDAPPPPPVKQEARTRRVAKKPRPMTKSDRKRRSVAGGALSSDDISGAPMVARPMRRPKPTEPITTSEAGGDFEGREARINGWTSTVEDALATFAIDVDTAAYSIARRTLNANRMPTASLVRVEEFINYFKYDYDAPTQAGELFTIQADGAKSPVDGRKHLLRVGIQSQIIDNSERLPANVVFLVDTSCSMSSKDKLPLAKKALEMAVSQLGEEDRVAITTYAGSVKLVLPPTNASNKRQIRRAIRSLFNRGGTAMSDGMTLAYQQAAEMLREGATTRVIIFSDGDANIGATTHEQILRSIQGHVKEGVFLTTVGFGHGNYKDAMMEQLANKGNGNYYYIDSMRMAERVFKRDFVKMLQDVAQDVKIQVDFDADAVESYRLVGYENRNVADRDFRNDAVDAGEIGAGHQVTALFELVLTGERTTKLGTVRVRAKRPRGTKAKEVALAIPTKVVDRPFHGAPEDLRFATAVLGGAELLRRSPHAQGWTYARVISIVSDTRPFGDADRAEFVSLMKKAARLSGETRPIGMR